ncbi:exosortase family protein XrtF [Aestuariibaculum sediminum]|uniref:Exosortase family protein XrtF n=1 Tax=Aestuariibaculum sediminum TaxID=2770637 RepID=A0A8J6Q2Z5_9FLAO|nr:exosortase family protein XrtF [Aestuariibaculum sediminum]MBD0832849.1 exosortase family protein XrtF [Aestuariibaculum sediminum]
MKALFIKYRLVIRFIITFLFAYLILSMGYKFYLELSEGYLYYPDYLTYIVGEQSKDLLQVLGFQVNMLPHPNEPSIKVIINNQYVSRIIEGCNGFSVIILFVSFIAAFASDFKTTTLYAFIGSVFIYVINLFRIVLINIGLYHYPKYQSLLHEIIFPIIIYGMMFLLWMIWVNRFSKMKDNHA